jgi:hypothetical protein
MQKPLLAASPSFYELFFSFTSLQGQVTQVPQLLCFFSILQRRILQLSL